VCSREEGRSITLNNGEGGVREVKIEEELIPPRQLLSTLWRGDTPFTKSAG
jgi:hypothetical protein